MSKICNFLIQRIDHCCYRARPSHLLLGIIGTRVKFVIAIFTLSFYSYMGFCMSKVIKKMYARRQCLELRIITHYLRSKNDLRHRNICKKFVHDGAKIGISLILRWNLHSGKIAIRYLCVYLGLGQIFCLKNRAENARCTF